QGGRPDGIFAGSDSVGMGAILALRDAGLAVPADVSVIGYNDLPMAQYFQPPLTTIRQDTHQAGSLLVEKLFQALEGIRPEPATVPTTLVVRGTRGSSGGGGARRLQLRGEEPRHGAERLIGLGQVEEDPVRVRHGLEEEQTRIDARGQERLVEEAGLAQHEVARACDAECRRESREVREQG